MTQEKYNIWILDHDNALSSKVLHCLGADSRLKLHIISRQRFCHLKFSRFVSSCTYLPEDDTEKVKLIKSKLSQYDNNLLLPVYEPETLFLIKYQNEFLNLAKIVSLPELKNYQMAVDKGRLAQFMSKCNILYPKIWYYGLLSNFNCDLQQSDFPVILKATSQSGGDGIYVAKNQVELDDCICKADKNCSYILQKYIEGSNAGCSVLCENGDVIIYDIQQGAVLNENPFSPANAIEFIEDENILNITKKLMKELNWNGVANIDFRRDSQTGEIFVLEINARYWASLLGSLNMDLNFPLVACCRALKIPYKNVQKRHGRHIIAKDYLQQYFKPGRVSNQNQRYSFSESNLRYLLSDPMPSVFRVIDRVKKKIM